MSVGEVLARSVMGKDFVEPEQPVSNWRTKLPNKRPKAKKVMHGFDPRKIVSTVSFTCSACGQHCGRDDEQCPHCHAEFVDTIWSPPADIREALDKQKPMAVKLVKVGGIDFEVCPRCNEEVYEQWCEHCGQHLDWRDVK